MEGGAASEEPAMRATSRLRATVKRGDVQDSIAALHVAVLILRTLLCGQVLRLQPDAHSNCTYC